MNACCCCCCSEIQPPPYAVRVAGDDGDAGGTAWRDATWPLHAPLQDRLPPPDDHVATVRDLWLNAARKHGGLRALGWRPRGSCGGEGGGGGTSSTPTTSSEQLQQQQHEQQQQQPPYVWMTYAGAAAAIDVLAVGLTATTATTAPAGLAGGGGGDGALPPPLPLRPGERLGIASPNCAEWVLADAAAAAAGLVSVPLHPEGLAPAATAALARAARGARLAAVACSRAALPHVLEALVLYPPPPPPKPGADDDGERQPQQRPRLVIVWEDATPRDGYGYGYGYGYGEAAAEAPSEQPPPWLLPPEAAAVAAAAAQGCCVVSFAAVLAAGRRRLHDHQQQQASPSPSVALLAPPRPGDVAAVVFTSGTTGARPKGALLSHANLVANAAACARVMRGLRPGDVHFSFLPLSHVFERKNVLVAVAKGLAVGFYRPWAPAHLLDDAEALRPHVFCAVPRVWARVRHRVMERVDAIAAAADDDDSAAAVRRAFEAECDARLAALQRQHDGGCGGLLPPPSPLLRRLRATLGGRVRYMTSGGAPLAPEMLAFLRAVFGGGDGGDNGDDGDGRCCCCHVLEGYGQTEAGCTVTIGRPGDATTGHVGAPVACCEVRLWPLPHLAGLLPPALGAAAAASSFAAAHARAAGGDAAAAAGVGVVGEVCVRGPSVFLGYVDDDAATEAALSADGWLRTGDVGAWLPGGRLLLLGRRSSAVKLGRGEFVAPERVEAAYLAAPAVAHAFVHADPLRFSAVAVVEPDPAALLAWWRERRRRQLGGGGGGGDDNAVAPAAAEPGAAAAAAAAAEAAAAAAAGDEPRLLLAALCREPAAVAHVAGIMAAAADAAGLARHERAAAVALVPPGCFAALGLPTPTLKLRRGAASRALADELARLYGELEAADEAAAAAAAALRRRQQQGTEGDGGRAGAGGAAGRARL